LLERNFKITSNDVGTEQCEESLKSFRQVFYTEIKSGFDEDEDLVENSECLVGHLTKLHLAEVAMKKYVYENTAGLSKRKKKKALRTVDKALEIKMESAINFCVGNEAFGELFDELYTDSNNKNKTEDDDEDESSPSEDYCVRKHFVDNNLINSTQYQVIVNPTNITTADLNCDEIVELLVDEAEDELVDQFAYEMGKKSKKKRRCIAKTVRTFKYFESVGRVGLLGEIGIPDEDKTQQRTQFIQAMLELYENVHKC